MSTGAIQRAFSSGELTPALSGRADLSLYHTGLKRCNNFIVRREGGVTKRPGTKFLHEVKNSAAAYPPKLVKFIFEAGDATYLLEFSDQVIRFFWHDAIVESSPGVAYEVATPYVIADVAALRYTQQADTIIITHPSYAPRKLVRGGHTSWTLSTISFAPGVDAPSSGLTGTAGTAGAFTLRYVVTSVRALTFEESYASNIITINSAALPTQAAPNSVSWTAVTGAVEYNVYLDILGNGLYGFVGTTKTVSGSTYTFKDGGNIPDYNRTPPEAPVNPVPPGTLAPALFSGSNYFPSRCRFHQQRLWFANQNNNRETIWGSRVGVYTNFSRSTPLQDDDAIEFILSTNYLSPVLHLIALKNLLILNDQGEFRVRGDETGAVTPSSINADQEGYIGFSDVEPVAIGNTLLYAQAKGTVVREMQFDQGVEGLGGADISVLASHLFNGYEITALEFQQVPWSVLWALRSDGRLLGCTYMRDQQLVAWHQHGTADLGPGCAPNATIETLCVLPDTANNQDVLYMVVKRTINGSQKRYIERLGPPFYEERTEIEDAISLDSAKTYSGSSTTSITGLSHLEGQTVAILAVVSGVVTVVSDGITDTTKVVSSGAVSVPAGTTKAHVGIPITFAEIEKLELDADGSAIRAKRKRVPQITAIVYGADDALLAGADRATLTRYRREAYEPSETWRTGQLEWNLTTDWNEKGSLLIQHRAPKPCTIAAVIPEIEIGG